MWAQICRRATFALLEGVRRGLGQTSPVPWVWTGQLAETVARRLSPLAPPVLVLSLPRSGSSWVGEMLGRASNALYLREPLTQTRSPEQARQDAVFPISQSLPPPAAYRKAAEDAFAGVPRFPRSIVLVPRQWALRRRPRARIVVKEVNPFACEWLVADYRPKVILLTRHPLSIAQSYRRMGWVGTDAGAWRALGERMSCALAHALVTLEAHGDFQVAHYEALCADPVGGFAALFGYADLPWTDALAERARLSVVPNSSLERAYEPVSAEAVGQLRAGYLCRSLPWYQSDADWCSDTPGPLHSGRPILP